MPIPWYQIISNVNRFVPVSSKMSLHILSLNFEEKINTCIFIHINKANIVSHKDRGLKVYYITNKRQLEEKSKAIVK